MSMSEIQKHLDQEPISPLGRGMESVVYGTSRLVIKLSSPHPSLPRHLVELHAKNPAAFKETMGGLVVPFEVPKSIRAHQVTGTWLVFWKKKEEKVFNNPVVQGRFNGDNTFEAKIKKAVVEDNREDAVHQLSQLSEWIEATCARGFIPMDIHSSNFVYDEDQGLRLFDFGAVMGEFPGRSRLVNSGTPELAKKQGELYHGDFSELLERDGNVKKAFEDFKRRLLDFYSTKLRRALNRAADNAEPVPDLSL